MDEACVGAVTRPRHRILAVSAVFVAVGAWFGAVGLVSGWLSVGHRVERRLPLRSPVLGGIALAIWVAIPFTLLARRAWHRDPAVGAWSMVCGGLLVLWLAVQLAFIRTFTPFHPVYGALGLAFMLVGMRFRDRRVPDVDRAAVDRFLASHRIVLVGASDDPKRFARTIGAALTEHGHEVVPVNPNRDTVAGMPCSRSVLDVTGEVDAVMVMVTGDAAVRVVGECIERGVPKVWLFRGAGAGALSPRAVGLCRDHGIDVVAGACPLMFLSPVAGAHSAHLAVRKFTGAVA